METVESELTPLPRTRDGIATNQAPSNETQVVALVPKYRFALPAAIVSEAEPLIVVPVSGYTVSVFAPSLRTTIIAPASTAGSFTPVEAAAVETRTQVLLTCVASVAVVPAAVTLLST
jgi:hypothetical protein